jgi:hypothetical protein
MKTIDIGIHKVEIYDSIDELPVKRFHKFNKYLLVDAGIGSDMMDLNDRILKIMRYIDKSDKTNAKVELENLRQSIYLISQETNVKHLSFMALVKSIDGVEVTDLSDDNLKKLQKTFDTTPLGFFSQLLMNFKKKVDTELALYFPGQFDDAASREYCDKLKARILLQLDSIIRKTNNTEEIDRIDDFLLTLAKPKIFSGRESAEIAYDKQFEDMCLFLAHELSLDIDKLSVLQFYNSFEYIKKIRKKQNGR